MRKISGIGTVYIIRRERSRQEIEKDIQNIRETGLKTVTIWPGISWWDSKRPEKPSCDSIIHALETAGKNGLGVILETVGQNPGYELIPDSMMKNEYLTDDDIGFGREINYNHPEVKNITAANLEFLVKQVKECPALLSYDIFNETYFYSKDQYTANLFRLWLEKKYGTIDNLNENWESTFKDFKQIDPKRKYLGANMWGCLVPGMDWERFRCDNLTEIIGEWVGVIKKHDPDRPVMADNGECTFATGLTGGSDDWKLAEQVDIYGTTYYPRSACGKHYMCNESSILRDEDFWSIECALNATRSAAGNKPWVISELQTHTKNAMMPSTRVEPEHLKLWLWQALALGCKSITFWKWRPFKRGRQSTGRGLTLQNGKSSERQEAVAEVAGIFNANAELFQKIENRRKEVAILTCQDTKWLVANVLSDDKDYCKKSLMGWSKLIWERSWNFDYLRADIASTFDLSNYRVVIAPGIMVIGKAQLDVIRKYVENGGIFISDGRFGIMDEQNYVYDNIPGNAFSELAGYQELDISPPEMGFNTVKIDDVEFKNQSVFSTSLSINDKLTVMGNFANGKPAVVERKYGEGFFLHYAFDFGYTYFKGFVDEVSRAFDSIINRYENNFFIKVDDGAKLISRHAYSYANGIVIFLINYDTKKTTTEFSINTKNKFGELKMIFGMKPLIKFNNGNSIDISKTLKKQEICVFTVN